MQKKITRRKNAKNYANIPYSVDAIDNVLSDIFSSRDANYGADNDYSLKNLLRPEKLKGLGSAIELLANAIKLQKKILIVGDFDADGATSTALACRCLDAFGCNNVDFLVPNRFVYGYGLTPEIVEEAHKLNPGLIVTVDNGISSIEGVALARKKGIDVLVTDHHLPSKTEPYANAIVNPNQNGCEFLSKNLAGVGVIFYVMSALRRHLRKVGWFSGNGIVEPNMAMFLDLVALGTVADVVPLDYNNRILVFEGIRRIKAGHASSGINALIKVSGKDRTSISSSDLGFALGPRINAAGRLDDMSLGIRCLLSDDFNCALECANELDDLNKDRKVIETSMKDEAVKILSGLMEEDLEQQFGICLFKSDWHQGVIGILASRIKDRLHRPTIIFAEAENGELKGSGRSIPGIHLRDVLDEIASKNPGMLEKFGGHAMAAGMSLAQNNLGDFKREFNLVVSNHLNQKSPEPLVQSDGELPEELMQIELAREIKNAGPWGQHFPEPAFDGVFNIVQQRIVGQKHLKLLVTCERFSNKVFDAIAFNVDLNLWPNQSISTVELVFQLDINEFRGETSVQLLVSNVIAIEHS